MPVIYSKGPTAQQFYEEIEAEDDMRRVIASVLRGVFDEDDDSVYFSNQDNNVPDLQRPTTRRLSNEAPIFVFDDPLADYGVPAPSLDLIARSRSPPITTSSNLRGMARLRSIAPPAIITDVLDDESFVQLGDIQIEHAPATTSGLRFNTCLLEAAKVQSFNTPEAPAMAGSPAPGAAIGAERKNTRTPRELSEDQVAFLNIMR
ncbi:hypothetical protein NLJ89_g3650 [Agrocybe chaxingu]|uniref:Uncharacterized protein n=1 Tax=Agrocybe chaxingu TaxID=84603 RepID=A0A9W8MY78_9AGAR|nr:hypothetical protein NLJ89_g3650 [Agrocybe chaxingu]